MVVLPYKLIPYNNMKPSIDETAYISDGVTIVGDTKIGANSSIWFGSVLRGDVAPIHIGSNTNLQDASVIHTSRFDGPVMIGDNVTIGHMALIHACIIESNSFVGMRAAIMDHAVVQEYGFVAAGSLLTPRKIVKSKELWAGSPAKFVRYLTDAELEQMVDTNQTYVMLGKRYMRDRGHET